MSDHTHSNKPTSPSDGLDGLYRDEGFSAWVAFEMICLIAAGVFFFGI